MKLIPFTALIISPLKFTQMCFAVACLFVVVVVVLVNLSNIKKKHITSSEQKKKTIASRVIIEVLKT